MLTTILFSAILLDISNMEKVLATMTTLTLHGVTDSLSPEYEKYSSALQTAGEAFREAEALFNDPAFSERRGWKKDTSNDVGDVVYGKSTPRGKMVAVETELPSDVDFVMSETWKGVDGLPKWNKNINFASTIASPTEHFDIITYGNNDVLIVSGRDFVSSRVYRKIEGGGYIMASKSIDLPGHPAKDGKVRAELVLAGARFRPHPDKANVTLVNVVMLADLKGMLPRFLINQVLGKIMLMDTETNRKHFEDLNKDRKHERVKRDEGAEKQIVEESPEKQNTDETQMVDEKRDESAETQTVEQKPAADESTEKQTEDEKEGVKGDESAETKSVEDKRDESTESQKIEETQPLASAETNAVDQKPAADESTEKEAVDEKEGDKSAETKPVEDKKDESTEEQKIEETQPHESAETKTVEQKAAVEESSEELMVEGTKENKSDDIPENKTVDESLEKQTPDETLADEDKKDESAEAPKTEDQRGEVKEKLTVTTAE